MATRQKSVRVYRPKAFLRFAGGGLCLVFGSLGLIVGGYFSLAKGVDVQGLLVSVVMGGAFLFTGLQIARMQVVLGDDEIRVQGALRETCVPFSQIAEIDVERQGAGQNIRLLNAHGKVVAKISNWIDGYQEILGSLAKRIKTK